MKNTINGKVFFIICIAALLSMGAVLPCSLALQVVQNAILFAGAIFGGLFLAEHIRLGIPVLESATRGGSISDRVRFGIANILAVFLLGLGHLPATSRIVPITGLVILQVTVLNGLNGIVCGWLYRKRGAESEMVAQFPADLVMHVRLAL